MQLKEVQQLILQHDAKFIDLRFSDTLGKEHHVTIPVSLLDKNLVERGQPFDGSSIEGWMGIECSDMLLKPDLSTSKPDPFYESNTISIMCDVIDPITHNSYEKCPRGIARRAPRLYHNLSYQLA